jgi:hypothetical protein
MDGSSLLGAGAGVAAGLPCFWQRLDYSECNHSGCSRGSSSCEPFQRTGCKPVERIDFLGVDAMASDHPRSWRKSSRGEELDGVEGSVKK